MVKAQMTDVKSLYQASHQEQFLSLKAQAESLLQELQRLKQNQLASDHIDRKHTEHSDNPGVKRPDADK